jgi:hypothetical protein
VASLGMDSKQFSTCMRDGRAELVLSDSTEANRLGVRMTPGFLIGLIKGDGKTIKVITRLTGALPYARIKSELDKAIGIASASTGAGTERVGG